MRKLEKIMHKPLALTLGLLLASSALAQSTAPDSALASEQVVAAASAASADAQLDPKGFEEWVEEFETKFQPMGVASGGRTFFSGQASVRVGPLDPNYGKELVIAYERAMFDMQADFILETYGRNISDRRSKVFEDASTNKDTFDPVQIKRAQDEGRIVALFDKALTLLDKKLDTELVKQGVPQKQVERMTVEQKKTTYNYNLTKELVKSAVRSMQGLVPVQTRVFTSNTPNGKGVIVGVIAAQSEKTRQFAQDMGRKRDSLVKGEPKALADLLPKQKAEYLDEMGLRYSYDASGRPMLLSYGRWSVAAAKDWSPSRLLRAKQIATETARSLAESSIIEFVNTNIEVSQKKTVGSLEEEISKKMTHFENGDNKGHDLIQEKVGETIDKTLRTAKSSASGDLRGTSVVKRWEATDENGIMHVGTVVTWTYGQLANANAIDNPTALRAGGTAQGPAKDESRSSRIINRVNDF